MRLVVGDRPAQTKGVPAVPGSWAAVFNASSVAMVVCDPAGHVLAANRAMGELLGQETGGLPGRAWQDLLAGDSHEEDGRCLAEVASGVSASYRFRRPLRRLDGVSAWGDICVSAMPDTDGRCAQLLWQVIDITERVGTRFILERQEQRYRLLTELASDVVYEADARDRVTWVAPAVTQTLGWRPDELVGRPLIDLLHPVDRRRAEARRRNLPLERPLLGTRGDEVEEFLLRVRCSDGTHRWMLWTGRETANRGTTGALHDVDELVRTRERIDADRARLQATLDSFLDPHVFLTAVRDDDGGIVDFVYTDANEAACRYNGVPRDQLIGARLLDLLPGHEGEGLLALYQAAIESGEPLVLDNFAYANELVGTERHYDIRAVRVGESLSYTWRDVTERHESARSLAQSEQQFRMLAENSSDVVLHTRDGVCLWVSPSVTEAIGWRRSELLGVDLTDLIHPDDVGILADSQSVVRQGRADIARFRVLAKTGRYHWAEVQARPYVDIAGETDGVVIALRVVDRVVAAEQALQQQARTDELTGLLNRRETFAALEKMMGHPPRTGEEVAVLFCDLDDFKEINDTFGHASGDELLRETARRAKSSVRAGDLVARFGGDELLVVLDGVHDLADAARVAEKLRAQLRLPVSLASAEVRISASIGVTLARRGEAVDEVMARADRAMYAAKWEGGDRVVATPTEVRVPGRAAGST